MADPLGRFIEKRGPQQIKNGKPLNSGEHMWVGDEGAARACQTHHIDRLLLSSIPRLDKTVRLSYGEIVALSGDFYESPKELFEEKPGPFSWIYEGKDISDLQEMFRIEMDWIKNDEGKSATNYPDQNIRMWWNAKGYLELALDNTDHFGWHNMKAYVLHHGAALAMAAGAQNVNDEQFRRALYTNAFADHFLTDGFAAGHVRVPRREIREWAEKKEYSEKLAGAMSKLLHDQDGHVSTLHSAGEGNRLDSDGLAVRNANGDSWHTRCDGQLFLPKGADTTLAVKLPVRAVEASVGELLIALKTKAVPSGMYTATQFVAFADPTAPPLMQKFSTSDGERVKQLLKSVAWYTNVPWLGSGLNEDNLREFLNALPALMDSFRANIAKDLQEKPNLTTRLAPGYIDAYRSIA